VDVSEDFIALENPQVGKGGTWKPQDCEAWQKVAIIIPYRNREKPLNKFLRRIHPMLRRQKVHYRIILAEQVKTSGITMLVFESIFCLKCSLNF